MKSSIKKVCLFWLSLLWGLWIVSFINITNGADGGVEIKLDTLESQHTTLLHSLYLWKGDVEDNTWVRLKVSPWGKFLDILGWLVVSPKYVKWTSVAIGWWNSNIVNGRNSWIGWWKNNKVGWDWSTIGWWESNMIWWDWAVVVWWINNYALVGGVVAGWQSGYSSDGWVILWWLNSTAWKNSMVFNWQWEQWSFVFNGGSTVVAENSAYIGASNWLLIWTNTPITDVSLVVSGAVKIGNSEIKKWGEIVNNGWCISAYDNTKYLGLGRSSGFPEPCWGDGSCLFWWVYIQNWDTVTGYVANADWFPYWYGTCSSRILTCTDWTLKPDDKTYYPNCHRVSSYDSVYGGEL